MMKSRRWMWVGGAVFAVFALLQLNDPDPLAWVVIYGMTAIYSCIGAVGRLSRGPVALWALIMGVFAAMTAAFLDGAAPPEPNVWGPLGSEALRETLGLGLAAVWSVALALVGPVPADPPSD